jgi:PPM family protein phosphatase
MSARSQLPQSSVLELEFAQFSDAGTVQNRNEDYCGYWLPASPELARSHGWLFAVADGVGGQDLGEVASRLAIESLTEGFRLAKPGEPHTTVLQRLVQAANCRVHEAGKSATPDAVNMATTVVACALRGDRVVVANVGDSRCYLIRQGQVSQLTRDHTLVADQIRLGFRPAKEAQWAETRHTLSRSVGRDLFTAVDTNEYRLEPADILLLCTGGLYASIPAVELADIVSSYPDPECAARKLVDLANQRDGADNATVQVIRVGHVEAVGINRGRHYKRSLDRWSRA